MTVTAPTDEMRALLGKQMFEQTAVETEKLQSLFGTAEPEEQAAIQYLIVRNWQQLEDGFFRKPIGRSVTDDEWFVLQFLIDAFGYQGMRFKL